MKTDNGTITFEGSTVGVLTRSHAYNRKSRNRKHYKGFSDIFVCFCIGLIFVAILGLGLVATEAAHTASTSIIAKTEVEQSAEAEKVETDVMSA